MQAPEEIKRKADYGLLDKDTIWFQEDPGKKVSFVFCILMPFYYVSKPKHWSPGNVGVSPYLYPSIQDPTEKCPVVFFNACSKWKRT